MLLSPLVVSLYILYQYQFNAIAEFSFTTQQQCFEQNCSVEILVTRRCKQNPKGEELCEGLHLNALLDSDRQRKAVGKGQGISGRQLSSITYIYLILYNRKNSAILYHIPTHKDNYFLVTHLG